VWGEEKTRAQVKTPKIIKGQMTLKKTGGRKPLVKRKNREERKAHVGTERGEAGYLQEESLPKKERGGDCQHHRWKKKKKRRRLRRAADQGEGTIKGWYGVKKERG